MSYCFLYNLSIVLLNINLWIQECKSPWQKKINKFNRILWKFLVNSDYSLVNAFSIEKQILSTQRIVLFIFLTKSRLTHVLNGCKLDLVLIKILIYDIAFPMINKYNLCEQREEFHNLIKAVFNWFSTSY